MKYILLIITLLILSCTEEPLEPIRILPPEITLNPFNARVVGEGDLTYNHTPHLNDKESHHFTVLRNEAACLQIFTPHKELEKIVIYSKSPLAINAYRIGLIRNSEEGNAWYPDVLVPMSTAQTNIQGTDSSAAYYQTIFTYTDKLTGFPNPVKAKLDGVWLEFPYPVRQPNSPEQLTMEIITASLTLSREVQIQYEVYPDSSTQLILDMNEYGYKHYRAAPDDTTAVKRNLLDIKAHRFARKHGAILNPLPYRSQRGIPYKTSVPKLLNDDLLNPLLDWTEFDARFAPLYDGSAFQDGKPLSHAYLPFNPEWPAPLTLYFSNRQRYEAIWQAFAKQFIQHFQKRGWINTTFQVYCNQKPNEKNGIPWNLDEPKQYEDYKALHYYHQLTESVFSESFPLDIRFRIDISHFFCDEHKGFDDRDLRINKGYPFIEDIPIWAIAGHSIGDSLSDVKAQGLLREGKQVWLYGATPFLHQSGRDPFQLVYQSNADNLNGIMFWKSLARNNESNSGFDHIFYVAAGEAGDVQFLPTIRLKQFKRALDDLSHYQKNNLLTPAELAELYKSGSWMDIQKSYRFWR